MKINSYWSPCQPQRRKYKFFSTIRNDKYLTASKKSLVVKCCSSITLSPKHLKYFTDKAGELCIWNPTIVPYCRKHVRKVKKTSRNSITLYKKNPLCLKSISKQEQITASCSPSWVVKACSQYNCLVEACEYRPQIIA